MRGNNNIQDWKSPASVSLVCDIDLLLLIKLAYLNILFYARDGNDYAIG